MFFIGKYKIKNPYILAPMAGVSQMPFRCLAFKFGAALAPTELISAKGLFYENLRTKAYLTYNSKLERPFAVQLFGGEPKSMAIAAEKASKMGAQIIDINMGCPVKKVTKTNAGSALMCDYKRAALIVKEMIAAVSNDIPITAKIRSGWDSDNKNYLEVAKALEDAGISAIAIHPRTRAQAYRGKANWHDIAQLKKTVRIPVIGNGDVKSRADAEKMMNETGCDGVMVGRAALGNPFIFQELLGKNNIIENDMRLRVINEHLTEHIDLHLTIMDDSKYSYSQIMLKAIRSFRSHLIWYSRGLKNGATFRNRVMATEDFNELKDLITEFFLVSETTNDDEKAYEGIDYRQAFG